MSRSIFAAVKRGMRERRGKERAKGRKGKRMGREKGKRRRRRQVIKMEKRAKWVGFL